MNYKFRAFIVVIAFIALSACGTRNAILRTNNPVDLKTKGVAILSLGYTGTNEPYQAYWLQVSSVTQPTDEVMFFASPNNIFNDNKQTITASSGRSELVAVELPPGEYQVEKLGAFTDTGPYSGPGLKRHPLTVSRFTVVAGEISYLGSALLGRKQDGAFAYIVLDEFDRDIKRLRALRPDLGALPIQKSLLSEENFL